LRSGWTGVAQRVCERKVAAGSQGGRERPQGSGMGLGEGVGVVSRQGATTWSAYPPDRGMGEPGSVQAQAA